MTSVKTFPTIKAVRTFVVGGVGSGGDYHNVARGHWYVQSFPREEKELRADKYV